MHRQTPLNTSFVGYTAGGARSTVDKVDDTTQMQEMSGSFMANETTDKIESPQNYGFTSHNFEAEKDAMGKIIACAETFISFLGGSRSLPVTGPIDDRRHRLFNLKQGDTAMFRGRGDKQQVHMTQDGTYHSAPQDKTIRMQLVPSDSETNSTQQQQGGQQGSGSSSSAGSQSLGVEALADGGSSGGSGGSSGGQGQGGQQKKRGQKAIYEDGKDSYRFMDLTKDKTRASGTNVHLMLQDKKTYVHVADDKNVYAGGEKGQGSFAKVVTVKGPAKNVLGKVG
jgi:phage gp45-like